MALLDWSIVAVFLLSVVLIGLKSMSYNKSVADFLAANRCAGPYLLAVAEGAAGVGAISYIASFEMYYKAGFSPFWWSLLILPVGMMIALSGWVIYRFRQTRALTLSQFLEMRYSKKFRIFMGVMAFISGILNFGIFPAVGARFFIYFCNLPEQLNIFGFLLPTVMLIMAILLLLSLAITLSGGQIALIITDFCQGVLGNISLVIVAVSLFLLIDWSKIVEALSLAPPEASMLNPLKTSKTEDFNIWFFLITAFGMFYGTMSWQGAQGFNASAKDPHAARTGKILGTWRAMSWTVMMVILPIYAYTYLNHPDMGVKTEHIQRILSTIDNTTIRDQVTTSVVLSNLLPKGVAGLFCALILAAFIANHNSYLHSWGSIFIQDVLMPLRKRPFSQREHIRFLRFSIIGVAVFIFIFSSVYRQTQYIFMYFAITGAIYLGGAGAAIVGGLYWKRGTTIGAWVAMILGSSIAVSGMIIQCLFPKFFLNGQQMWFIAMVSAAAAYIVVSLCTCKQPFNLDKMLHRGQYAYGDNQTIIQQIKPRTWLNCLGITHEFSSLDKILFIGTLVYCLAGCGVVVFVSCYSFFFGLSPTFWNSFWHGFVIFAISLTSIVTIWFCIGGIINLREMLALLRTVKRSEEDDGRVELKSDSHAMSEEIKDMDEELNVR